MTVVIASRVLQLSGVVAHHIRCKNLFVAPGDLEVAVAAKRLEEKSMPRVLRDLQQFVDCDVHFREVQLHDWTSFLRLLQMMRVRC